MRVPTLQNSLFVGVPGFGQDFGGTSADIFLLRLSKAWHAFKGLVSEQVIDVDSGPQGGKIQVGVCATKDKRRQISKAVIRADTAVAG